jgi:hypothetical protein
LPGKVRQAKIVKHLFIMSSRSHRHTNQDFASKIGLLFAELGLIGVMAYMFLGNVEGQFIKGIAERLPPYQYEEPIDTIFLPAGHVLHLELPVGNDLFCEGKRIKLKQLPSLVERHLYRSIDKDTIFFVSLRTERAAAYPTYIAVKDILLAQQYDRLNELSLQNFGEPYSTDMPFSQRKALRKQLDLGLSEWMPDEGRERLKMLRRTWW